MRKRRPHRRKNCGAREVPVGPPARQSLAIPKTPKIRLDLLLVQKGLAETRSKAQALILAGQVIVLRPQGEFPYPANQIKPGALFPGDCVIKVKLLPKFVSRGGEKLEAAFKEWNINVSEKTCLDVGASTGGFTDCLLQRGAKKVYCLDVGHGQLHPKIRNDSRAVVLEGSHVLKWTPVWPSDDPPRFVAIDVSFISLEKILFRVYEWGSPGLEAVALIKPQFEVGPQNIKKGIVKDSKVREEAVERLTQAARTAGFTIAGRMPCPVRGAMGNQEELIFLKI